MRRSLRTRFTPAPLALAAALALALAASHAPLALAQDGAAAAATLAIDIPAQPLAQALNELARQAKLQLSFPPDLVAGKTAPAVSGQLTPRQALDRLLAPSGLAATVDGNAVVVKAAKPARAETGNALPAVKVTARADADVSPLSYLSKRSESGALGAKAVLDTPFSVTVVDSEDITLRGARSIGQIFVNDVSVSTPTPSFSTDWWGTQIRGLPVRNYYVDDIPMLLYWGGDFATEVVESVTALKGLTGFMYGFGEPGGALSYQLKRPKKANETMVDLGWRNPGLFSLHLDTSRRIDEDLALRANLATERGTAYNEAGIKRTVASLAVEKQFGASLSWLTKVIHEDSRNRAEPFQFYLDDLEASGDKLPRPSYRYGDFNVDNSFYRTRTLLATTELQWRIDDQWKLRTQAGYSRKDHRSNKSFAYLRDGAGDYDGYIYNFAGQLDTVFAQSTLQGSVDTGSIRHEIVGGLGLQKAKDKWSPQFDFRSAFDGNIHQELNYRADPVAGFGLDPDSSDTTQTYAFLSDTLHFNAQWQALLGLRYTDHDLKDTDGDDSVDSGIRTRKATPTLALIYKPDGQTSFYGSYVESLEPGSRVGGDYANEGDILPATISKQYEIGAKHQSHGTDYTAALFRVERANQMTNRRDGQARPTLTQDGLVVYQGVELTGAHQLTPDLNVGAGIIHLDANIEKVSPPVDPDTASVEGHAPAYAYKWQFVANAQYKVPAVRGLKLHGNVRYYGDSYATDRNILKVPSRTIANAGFSYDFKARDLDWTLIGNVNNLFNKKYWAGGGWTAANMGEARNFSLTLRALF